MVDYKKITKVLTYALVVAFSFVLAQSYELYKQHEKFVSFSNKYKELVNEKTRLEAQKAAMTFVFQLPKEQEQNSEVSPINLQKTATPTLAYKNKNPLNIKSMGKQKWRGQVGTDEFGHAIFSSWEHGLRAAGFTLKAYARWHGVDTITGLVDRFCEAKGKIRDKYISFICTKLKVKPDEKIDFVKRMPELLRVMARFESGMDLPDELFVSYDLLAYL